MVTFGYGAFLVYQCFAEGRGCDGLDNCSRQMFHVTVWIT